MSFHYIFRILILEISLLGDKISEDEAESRSSLYEKHNNGSFIFYGIKDVDGKNVWYDAH